MKISGSRNTNYTTSTILCFFGPIWDGQKHCFFGPILDGQKHCFFGPILDGQKHICLYLDDDQPFSRWMASPENLH